MADDVVKSVGRVLAVLELFRVKREPLSGSQIATELGYPSSSTNAVLKSLVKLGYLSWDTQSRRYFPTVSVTGLGEWIPDKLLTNEILEMLEALHEGTGETVTLSTQIDLNMQFVRVLPGTFPISLSLTEGYLGPLFGSAVGTACLAPLSDDQISKLLTRVRLQGGSAADQLELAEVMAEVEATRERGYAVGFDLILQDTGAIAMIIPSHPKFVIGVGGLSQRIQRNKEAIIDLMQRTVGDRVVAPLVG
ncbi:helix-turn-helix domain-containing protein [uncultured Erythrobacter sp.]|uniref:IclR family transcriptional regulator n=1 Tax=uncultured Erythrobacter sp. TaxID=263913 RepID=UPI00262F6A02|nr:helix-turn-helix domain-containing protein [uncultured Erythrobacter sp.]